MSKILTPDIQLQALQFGKTLSLLEFILKNETLNISHLDLCLEFFSSKGDII